MLFSFSSCNAEKQNIHYLKPNLYNFFFTIKLDGLWWMTVMTNKDIEKKMKEIIKTDIGYYYNPFHCMHNS